MNREIAMRYLLAIMLSAVMGAVCHGQTVLKGHASGIRSVVFSADGATLMSLSIENEVKTWDVRSAKVQRTLRSKPGWQDGVLCSNGAILAMRGGAGMRVDLVRFEADKEKHLFFPNGFPVTGMAFHPGGESMAVWGNGDFVQFWDIAALRPTKAFSGSVPVFSPDGKTLALVRTTGKSANTVRLLDFATGKPRHKHNFAGGYAAFSPDGKTVATADTHVPEEIVFHLWDVETGKKKITFGKSLPRLFYGITLLPDGRTLALREIDEGFKATLTFWDIGSGKQIHSFQYLGFSCVFRPDGKIVATEDFPLGGSGRSIKLWDTTTGKLQLTLKEGDSPLHLAFSPDGRILASWSSDENDIHLWDVSSVK
jgi:WD40 repeat protein